MGNDVSMDSNYKPKWEEKRHTQLLLPQSDIPGILEPQSTGCLQHKTGISFALFAASLLIRTIAASLKMHQCK